MAPQKSSDTRKWASGGGHGSRTEAVRDRAVLALLSESTIIRAAKRAGVNEKTLRGWMADDEDFCLKLAVARRATFDAGMRQIQVLTSRAVETLAALMKSAPPAVRLAAARSVLDLGIHQHEAEAICSRIDQIEARLQEQRRTGA